MTGGLFHPANLLVYHTGALGDFITMLPVLQVIRRERPGCRITLLTRALHGVLARAANLAVAWEDAACARFLSLYTPDMNGAMREFLGGFDGVIAFTGFDSPVIPHLHAAGITEVLHQPPFPDRRMPVIDYHLELLAGHDVNVEERIPRISLPPCADCNGRVIIHPGSGSARKNWPLGNFVAVRDRLADRGIGVTWVLGEAEVDAGITLADGDPVLREPSLVVLARCLAGCACYLGNDSGVSHLAAAAGCPVVALFGPSDPAVWAPRGKVVRVIASTMPCGPCHPGGTVACVEGEGCMRGILVDAVVCAVDELKRVF